MATTKIVDTVGSGCDNRDIKTLNSTQLDLDVQGEFGHVSGYATYPLHFIS